jgi:hypothetical protein
LPETIPTDPQRLQQILNNLLSNAFKFTEKGQVQFVAEPVTSGWSPTNENLNRAGHVIAFKVIDTGIGIPLEKQHSIFESFAQVDGSTSRKYGGTGLGLSICRELTRLLSGEIRLESEPGVGSVFTVYLPVLGVIQDRRLTPGQADAWSDTAVQAAPQPAAVGAGGVWRSEPVSTRVMTSARSGVKSLLVVEDDPVQRQYIVDLMSSANTRRRRRAPTKRSRCWRRKALIALCSTSAYPARADGT